MKRLVQCGVALALCVLLLQAAPAAPVAGASTSVASIPADIVDSAEVVVNATITGAFVIEIETVPHTVAMLSVATYVKGQSAAEIPVLSAGGMAADGRNVSVSHAAQFRVGQQVQAALVPSPQVSLSASLLQLDAIVTPLFEVASGDQGVVELSTTGLEASAAGVGDFLVTPGLKWSTFSPAPTYLVNTQGSGLSSTATIAAVNRAAQAWEDDPGSVVDFDYAGTTEKGGYALGDGDNVISFRFMASRGFVAQTSWFMKPDGTYEFDMVLNTRFAFGDGAVPGRYDVETLATHEFGHALGLGHPFQYGGSQEVMFATIFAGQTKQLGSGDRSGIRMLYPPVLPSVPCAELAVTVDLNTGVGSPTEGDDVILGTPGPDLIWALGGDDTICGGGGIDRIFAGEGQDLVFGEGGSDRIWGEAGNDAIYAGAGADRVRGGEGDDVIFGQGGQDQLFGGAGNDELQGNWQSDQLSGGAGDDKLRGARGKDIIYGEDGDDALYGGLNTDYLDGGDGLDTGDGQRGRDNPVSPGVSGCERLETSVSC